MSDESRPQETTGATARTAARSHGTAPGDHFEVVVEPTGHSRKNGYDLTIRQDSHGWCKSDLTLSQLILTRNTLTEFIDARLAELGV